MDGWMGKGRIVRASASKENRTAKGASSMTRENTRLLALCNHSVVHRPQSINRTQHSTATSRSSYPNTASHIPLPLRTTADMNTTTTPLAMSTFTYRFRRRGTRAAFHQDATRAARRPASACLLAAAAARRIRRSMQACRRGGATACTEGGVYWCYGRFGVSRYGYERGGCRVRAWLCVVCYVGVAKVRGE
jgi:hypothetical protein